jgi:Lanthionine synthetase C-like protein
VLYTPERHEPLADERFDEDAARASIARIAQRARRELDADAGLWPRDTTDEMEPGEGRAASLYWGAAGVAWALHELQAEGYVDAEFVDLGFVETLERRLQSDSADPDFGEEGVWFGVAGVLAVAERHWPDASRRDRLAELVLAAIPSPGLEPMVGHPGFMSLAALLHARTGEERWVELWTAGADRLLDEWHRDDELDAWLWTPQIGRDRSRYLGAAHGLAGNVHVLLQGRALLAAEVRTEVERRAVATLTRQAIVDDSYANWPSVAGGLLSANDRIRVQWCHGAPGVLTGMRDAAPDDDVWNELMLAAGRLVWAAGPLRDAPGLCHGTAGNAYALLALWQRTGDERWLERARALAQHAALQSEERAARLGRGWHSLFTGDEGVAMCLASCIAGDARLPIADRLI